MPAGLSPRMALYVHSIVHAALKDAMRWNRVARKVAGAATPPPVGSTRRGPRTTWTAAQLGAFLDFIADDRCLAPWIFLATTGCRRGECLGLRWTDLDLDRATAVVSRQVTSIDHEIVVKELPKTKRGHMVALDSNTVAMLRRWRAQQNEEKLLVGPGYVDEGYVFCKPTARCTSRTASAESSSASRSSTTGPTPTSRCLGSRSTGCATPGRRWRYTRASTSGRQRPAQPLEHLCDSGDLHARHATDAKRRRRAGGGEDLRRPAVAARAQ